MYLEFEDTGWTRSMGSKESKLLGEWQYHLMKWETLRSGLLEERRERVQFKSKKSRFFFYCFKFKISKIYKWQYKGKSLIYVTYCIFQKWLKQYLQYCMILYDWDTTSAWGKGRRRQSLSLALNTGTLITMQKWSYPTSKAVIIKTVTASAGHSKNACSWSAAIVLWWSPSSPR